MLRALEWLLAGPWRLVLLVALVACLPIVIVGELSASDTRERIRESELRSNIAAAARAGDLVASQIATVRDQVTNAAANPNLRTALDQRDRARLAGLARDLKSVMSRDVHRLLVLDPADVVLAHEPIDETVVGTSIHDLRVRSSRPGSAFFSSTDGLYSQTFAIDAGMGVFISSIVLHDRFPAGWIVAEIDLRFIRDWLAPSQTSTQDVYVVDERGRLIGQASLARTERLPEPFRDLSGDPVVAAALAGGIHSVEAEDPLEGGRRLLATSPVGDTDWQVIVARDPDVLESEVRAALAQLQVSRIALVGSLLIGSYALALAGSALVRQRRALAETNVQLARASEAKSQFLSSVSHELRTPMNAILGFTEALLAGIDGPLNAEQRASLTWVQRGGQDLLGLINEVLDLSKIEAGKLVISPEPFDPRDLVETVCAQHRSLAVQKGVRFAWRDAGMPSEVVLDRQRTRQILVNLCGNALKFTSEGDVEIVGSGAGDGLLRLAVRDTGPGIAPEHVDVIFQEFRQLEAGSVGSGLGLAISRRLARLMGGEIAVESAVGRGSTFIVTLPLDCRSVAAAPVPAVPLAARVLPSLLLSVDDDPSVAPLLEKMLADKGYQVVAAASPMTALADAKRLHPSVITLDVLMPDRNGRDVLRELRGDPATQEIPIIVLSVMDKADVPAGADAHISKPIRKDRLLRALEQVVPVTIEGR